LLIFCDTGGEDLLPQIVMDDETWVCHSEQQAVDGTAIQLQGRRNSRVPSAGKIVDNVFWNEKDVTLAKFLVKRTSVNSKCHIEMCRSLNARLDPFYPMR